jgi:pyruvate/2-oxoglutarate dehydrogenase complex dihydrolipoamide dehydrogenase (E3) component
LRLVDIGRRHLCPEPGFCGEQRNVLGQILALNGNSLRYDSAAMPAVIFTDPQVASVDLTEDSARAAGYDVRVSVLALDQLARALAARTRGV